VWLHEPHQVYSNIQDMARSGQSIHNGTRMEPSMSNRRTIGLCPEPWPFPPPVKCQVTKITTDNRRADVEEVLPQIRVLVKDTAKKLQATNDRLHAECTDNTAERPDDPTAEMASDVMRMFEYPTSLRSICVTVIIICC